jgi:hypothetical protein
MRLTNPVLLRAELEKLNERAVMKRAEAVGLTTKTHRLRPFYTENDPFRQDRLGRNIGKTQKQDAFLQVGLTPEQVRKTASFLSAFPMFVPSLSWQNDRLYI